MEKHKHKHKHKHPSQMVIMMIRNYIYEDKCIARDDQRSFCDQKKL